MEAAEQTLWLGPGFAGAARLEHILKWNDAGGLLTGLRKVCGRRSCFQKSDSVIKMSSSLKKKKETISVFVSVGASRAEWEDAPIERTYLGEVRAEGEEVLWT